MAKKLYLCFSTGTTFLDKLIQSFEEVLEYDKVAPKPLATHSYLVFADDLKKTGIEARPPKVRSWDLSQDPRDHDRRYEIPITSTDYDDALAIAGDYVGRKYHYFGDILAGIYCLTKIPLYDPEKLELFCSQLCVEFLRGIGYDVLDSLPDSSICPATLEVWAVNYLTKEKTPFGLSPQGPDRINQKGLL